MNAFVKTATEFSAHSSTLNGGKTFNTSGEGLLDVFFKIGGMRGAQPAAYTNLFERALSEGNPDENQYLLARLMLWARDAREGAGERRAFRIFLKWLSDKGFNDTLIALLPKIAELGRFDDMFTYLDCNDTVAVAAIDFYINELRGGNGLAAKWMPRKGPVANRVRGRMKLKPAEFRRLIVDLTNVVETQMCAKNWDGIDYNHVPSKAMSNYMTAFHRNDGERFKSHIEAASKGEVNPVTGKVAKMNAGAIYPHEILFGTQFQNYSNRAGGQVMWDSLPNWVKGDASFFPVVDRSGSMGGGYGSSVNPGSPFAIATALGVYLAERNRSAFKDLLTVFAGRPKIAKLSGSNVYDKAANLPVIHDMTTNMEAVFTQILEVATNGHVPQEDMPTHIIVISDMEFNPFHHNLNSTEMLKQKFESKGYKVPNLVWWNVSSLSSSTPVRAHEDGHALVSGYSPAIMQGLLGGKLTPMSVLLVTIMKERYDFGAVA